MKKRLLFPFLGLLPLFAIAQPTSDTLSINKLKQIDYMLGTWEGEGWIMMGRDNKQLFTQNEIVADKTGGSFLLLMA